MDALNKRLFDELCKIPLLDPHSHINPHASAAKSLTDLLGYHYYTELAHSAGLDRGKIEAAAGFKQAELLAKNLAPLANTVQYSWLMELARDFFGFDGDDLTGSNVRGLFDRVEKLAAAPDWADQVFKRTNLQAIFLTNDFDDPLTGFDTNRYVPCLRTDDLVFKLGESSVRQRLERCADVSVSSLADVYTATDVNFERFVKGGARACAISLPPDFEPIRPPHAEGFAAFERILRGNASPEDHRVVAHAVFYRLADRCDEFGLPFDLMIGVNRRVYPDGVFQGQDLFDQRTSLIQYRHLFNDKPRVTFPISVLTHPQNQELTSYAWIFPNVVTSGHWWYSNIPGFIEADLRVRLEAVPATKQIGYYSDAYKLEFVLPKFNTYRRCLAKVLSENFVRDRRWSEDRALALGKTILRDNVEKIFPKKDTVVRPSGPRLYVG